MGSQKRVGASGALYTGGDFAAHQLGRWEGGHTSTRSAVDIGSLGRWSPSSSSAAPASFIGPSFAVSPRSAAVGTGGRYYGTSRDVAAAGSSSWSWEGIGGCALVLLFLLWVFGGTHSSKRADAPALSAFEQGTADRQAWEDWFSGLTGDYRAGANHWAAIRNVPYQGSCSSGRGKTSTAYRSGCLTAKEFLDSRQVDVRRITEDAYKRGWNSL